MEKGRTAAILGADWVNVVVGVAIFATPFATGDTGLVPYWSSLVVGGAVALLAVWNMVASRRGRSGQAIGTNGLELVGGVWLVLMPFLFTATMNYRWATVIEGIVLLVTSGYVAWALGRLRGALPGRAT